MTGRSPFRGIRLFWNSAVLEGLRYTLFGHITVPTLTSRGHFHHLLLPTRYFVLTRWSPRRIPLAPLRMPCTPHCFLDDISTLPFALHFIEYRGCTYPSFVSRTIPSGARYLILFFLLWIPPRSSRMADRIMVALCTCTSFPWRLNRFQ